MDASPDTAAHDLKLLPKRRVLLDILLVLARELLQAAFERAHHLGNVAQVLVRDFLAHRLESLRCAVGQQNPLKKRMLWYTTWCA